MKKYLHCKRLQVLNRFEKSRSKFFKFHGEQVKITSHFVPRQNLIPTTDGFNKWSDFPIKCVTNPRGFAEEKSNIASSHRSVFGLTVNVSWGKRLTFFFRRVYWLLTSKDKFIAGTCGHTAYSVISTYRNVADVWRSSCSVKKIPAQKGEIEWVRTLKLH